VPNLRRPLLALTGAALLAGCGGGDPTDTSTAARPPQPAQPKLGKVAPGTVPSQSLSKADTRKLKAFALSDRYVRDIVAGSHPSVVDVVPWLSEGGQELIGGSVEIRLSSPVRLANERLPGMIFPNQKAPPGTPTLYRFARFSATNVTELDVSVELAGGRAVQIEPAGDGSKVTKIELIGPPPKNPAYAPEPGY
jgi:hypothetical protein